MAELLVLLVIASPDEVHRQEVGIDTILKFVLRYTSNQVQRHTVAKLVLDVKRELVVLCVSAVETLGGRTKNFPATNRQSVTVGISDAFLEAREGKSHHRIHCGVRCRHNRPNAIDNGRAELGYGSGTACAQEICIGVTKPHTGRIRGLPLRTKSGDSLIRCRHIRVNCIGSVVVVIAIDGAIHDGKTHGKSIRQAAADVTLKILTVVALKTRCHTT